MHILPLTNEDLVRLSSNKLLKSLGNLKLKVSCKKFKLPTIPLLGIYSKKAIIEKVTHTPLFIAALFTIGRTWKQLRCPSTDDWVNKLWYIHTVEYYSAI